MKKDWLDEHLFNLWVIWTQVDELPRSKTHTPICNIYTKPVMVIKTYHIQLIDIFILTSTFYPHQYGKNIFKSESTNTQIFFI